MIDLKHTGPNNYRGIIWEPRRGGTTIAPGFNPGLKKKPNRFVMIFGAQHPKIMTKHKLSIVN